MVKLSEKDKKIIEEILDKYALTPSQKKIVMFEIEASIGYFVEAGDQ